MSEERNMNPLQGQSGPDRITPEPEAQAPATAELAAAQPAGDQPAAAAPAEPTPAAAAAPAEPTPAAPPASRRGLLAAIALAVAGAMAGAAVGTAATYAILSRRPAATAAAPGVAAPAAQARPVIFMGDVDVTAVYEAAAPAVVQISTRTGAGSGFIVDSRGYIVTNYHVVGSAGTVGVKLDDETTVEGRVLGKDPSLDLAVVQIDPDGRSLAVLPLGDSDQVRPGEPAIAIGFPFNSGESVTFGIISGVGRDNTAPNQRTIRNMIQTDAAINPGNSGGPLLNAAGQVIGVNTSIESPVRGFTGIGFAVPSNSVRAVLDDLIAGHVVQHPWLGISGQSLSAELAREWDLDISSGAAVMQVYPQSPAAKAGLRGAEQTYNGRVLPGDIVIRVDGRPVRAVPDISGYLDSKRVGDTVTITVWRNGEEVDLQVTLEAWPDQLSQQSVPDDHPEIPDIPFPFFDRP